MLFLSLPTLCACTLSGPTGVELAGELHGKTLFSIYIVKVDANSGPNYSISNRSI